MYRVGTTTACPPTLTYRAQCGHAYEMETIKRQQACHPTSSLIPSKVPFCRACYDVKCDETILESMKKEEEALKGASEDSIAMIQKAVRGEMLEKLKGLNLEYYIYYVEREVVERTRGRTDSR